MSIAFVDWAIYSDNVHENRNKKERPDASFLCRDVLMMAGFSGKSTHSYHSFHRAEREEGRVGPEPSERFSSKDQELCRVVVSICRKRIGDHGKNFCRTNKSEILTRKKKQKKQVKITENKSIQWHEGSPNKSVLKKIKEVDVIQERKEKLQIIRDLRNSALFN